MVATRLNSTRSFTLRAFRGAEVTARDRRTLELRQFFRLPRRDDETTEYDTQVYFYFPRGFGITAATWTHDAFYRDANIYMRLHAPELRLEEIADLNHPTNPASILRRKLPALLEEHAPTAASLETLAKTLGAELADATTSAVRALRKRVRKAGVDDDKGDLERAVSQTCNDLVRALAAVRRMRAKARAYRTVAPPTLLPALSFAEEYASAVIDEQLAELAAMVDHAPALRDGKGTALRVRLLLAQTAEIIHRRRHEQGFPSPAGESPEYFTYRIGLLKKELQRALYVDTRANARDPFYRNSAAMVGAGLAATWATLAQIPIARGGLTGTQSVVFIAAAVGAYVLKDRIKEWTRNTLSAKLLQWDHDVHIVGDALSSAGLGAFGGRAKERVRYVKEEDIPVDVTSLRKNYRTVRGVDPELEHVLHYHRKVRFECDGEPVPEGFGVQELLRLSLDEIIKRLDDPVDEVAYYDEATMTFRAAEMPKVYHLNLIVACTEVPTGERVLSRWRVVVNQQGIVHIDPVLERRSNINDAIPPGDATEPPLE